MVLSENFIILKIFKIKIYFLCYLYWMSVTFSRCYSYHVCLCIKWTCNKFAITLGAAFHAQFFVILLQLFHMPLVNPSTFLRITDLIFIFVSEVLLKEWTKMRNKNTFICSYALCLNHIWRDCEYFLNFYCSLFRRQLLKLFMEVWNSKFK